MNPINDDEEIQKVGSDVRTRARLMETEPIPKNEIPRNTSNRSVRRDVHETGKPQVCIDERCRIQCVTTNIIRAVLSTPPLSVVRYSLR